MLTPRKIIKATLKILGLHGLLMREIEKQKFNMMQRRRVNSILSFKRIYNYNIFIETGTYKGDLVELMRKNFKKIYSIEIGDELYAKACNRFKEYNHINIVHGDSAKMLPLILRELHEPAIFWLDAHDSGGDTSRGEIITPIELELETIMSHQIKNHVILIDDARDFTGRGGYPTAEKIKALAQKNNYSFENKDDNLRLYPSE